MDTLTDAHTSGELLTVKEAASRLRLHAMTVRRMIEDGRLPALRLGARGSAIRIDEDELERWLYGPGDGA